MRIIEHNDVVGAGALVRNRGTARSGCSALLCVASLLAIVMAAGCIGTVAGRFGDPNKQQKSYEQSLLEKPKSPARQREFADVRIVKLRVYVGHELRVQRVDWKVRLRKMVALANPILEREIRVRLVISFAQQWQRKSSPDDMAAMARELEAIDPGSETEWVLGLVTPMAYSTPSLHKLGIARVGGRHMVMRSASLVGRPGNKSMGTPEHIEVVILLHEVGHVLGELHARDERDFMFPSIRKSQKEFGRDRAKRMMGNVHARFTTPATRALAQTNTEPSEPPRKKTSGIVAMIDSADAAADSMKALQSLRTAAAGLEALGLDDDALWLRIATTFASRQALSSAEKALGHMKTARPKHATARWVVTTRSRVALPRTGAAAIPAAREPEYIELVTKLITSIEAGDEIKSRRVMKQVAKRFPRSAGLAVARCYRAVYAERDRTARRHCKRALALYPASSSASYLLGFMAYRRKRLATAVGWMKKALVADSYLQAAWLSLAKIYIVQEDTVALNKLLRDFESTFGQPMRF